MGMMQRVRGSTLAAGVLLAGMAMANEAHAITILTFGQSVDGNFVTATESGGTTTIASTNTAVTITQIDSPTVPNGTAAILNLTLVSTDAAGMFTPPVGPTEIFQNYKGTFTITSGANGTGVNYLTGSFTDLTLGSGSAATLSASEPGSIVSFTSAAIPDLASPRAVALSFANILPQLSIKDGSIASFTSSVSGTISAAAATPIPEPASLAVLGVSLLGLGMVRRHRRS